MKRISLLNSRVMLVALTILACLAVALSFRYTRVPFLLSPGFISIPFWVLLFRKPVGKYRPLWFNIASILLIIAIFEGICIGMEVRAHTFVNREVLERVYETEMDQSTGWKLIPSTSRITRKTVNGGLVYEARVTVDSNGLRITPQCRGACDQAILFFGDSFTYGEGVDDTLTLPWQFSDITGNKYRVYNFGVHAYGPQQILSLTEQGIVQSMVGEEVRHIVFQVIHPDHAYRLVGYWSWDISSPRYILDSSGEVTRSGDFSSNLRRYRFHTGIISRSAVFRKMMQYRRPLRAGEKELFIKSYRKTVMLLKEQFPGAQFHMVLWDWSGGADQHVFKTLEDAGIRIYSKDDIFQTKGDIPMIYRISTHDRHPNGEAYRIMAEYLCKQLEVD